MTRRFLPRKNVFPQIKTAKLFPKKLPGIQERLNGNGGGAAQKLYITENRETVRDLSACSACKKLDVCRLSSPPCRIR